jgi:hypothetical protein
MSYICICISDKDGSHYSSHYIYKEMDELNDTKFSVVSAFIKFNRKLIQDIYVNIWKASYKVLS